MQKGENVLLAAPHHMKQAPPAEMVQTRCVSLLSAFMCVPDKGSTTFDRVVQCALLVCSYPKVCAPKTLANAIALLGLCVFEDVRRFGRFDVLNKCLKIIQVPFFFFFVTAEAHGSPRPPQERVAAR
jgi:hypothetical protein